MIGLTKLTLWFGTRGSSPVHTRKSQAGCKTPYPTTRSVILGLDPKSFDFLHHTFGKRRLNG